jgi:hypothetical protein
VITFDQVLASMISNRQRRFGQKGNREAPDRLERWAEIEDRARAQVEDHLKRELAIKTDSRLSAEGRAEKLHELAQTGTEECSWLGRELAQIHEIEERLKSLCLDYMAMPKNSNESVEYFRGKEVRDDLRGQPQHDRDMRFLRAAESLDAEVMRALQSGPGGAWVKGEVVQRAEEMYGQRQDPSAWARLQSLKVYLQHVEALATHIGLALLALRADPSAIKKALGVAVAPEEPAHV